MDLKYSPTKMEKSMTTISSGWRKIVMAPSHVKIIAALSLFSSLFLLRTLLTNHELTSDSSYIVTSVSASADATSISQVATATPTSIASEPSSTGSAEDVISNDIIDATNNGTLGFSKIFYISLPYRTDRQDGMELLAKTTNISLTYQPGVLGKEINDKAKPAKEGVELKPEQWGCWRSHVDLWRKVVDENIETALIMEDDLDWDVNIHDVMHRLATQMRTGDLRKSKMSEFETTSAPYGLDWDTLHLGTCFDFPPNPLPKNIKYPDPHSPGRKELNGVYLSQLENVWHVPVKDSTALRILAPAWNPVCTIGYAITQRGAQRLLYNVGLGPIGDPVDVAMLMALKSGTVRGYSVIPPVLTTWKLGGAQGARDSDIDDVQEQKNKGMYMEGSRNLRNSARVAMHEMYGKEHEELVGPIDAEEAKFHAEKEKAQRIADEKWKAEEEKKKKEEEEKNKKEEEKKKADEKSAEEQKKLDDEKKADGKKQSGGSKAAGDVKLEEGKTNAVVDLTPSTDDSDDEVHQA